MGKKKAFWIVSFLLWTIFLFFFFIKTIPIPVENIEGANNPDEFIFGGFYYTSIIYELSVGNYFGSLCFALIFIIPFGVNYYSYKNGRKNGSS